MKRIRIIAALLAVVVVIALAVFFFLNSDKKESQNKTPVVVAAANIPEYTEITADMVQVIELDMDAVNPQAQTKLADVVGKTTTSQILKQEQILSSRLLNEDGTGSGFAYKIRDGYRAYSLNVAMDEGVSYLIQPGNHVDVVLVFDLKLEMEHKETTGPDEEYQQIQTEQRIIRTSSFLLQNINVLSVDYKYKPAAAEEEPYQYITAVLELKPEDVLVLNLEDYNRNTGYGELRLVLRENGDEEITETEPIAIEFIK